MKINKIWAAYFSPVGKTEELVLGLAQKMSKEMDLPLEVIDYTLPEQRQARHVFQNTDLFILGTPVYAGRIPNKILPYMQQNFDGNGALAVPVAVFGGRSFDDALVELRNLLEKNGFHTIAAAGLVGQHAFSTTLAAGRPDAEDRLKLAEFCIELAQKLQRGKDLLDPIEVPGNNPPETYYTPRGLDGKPTFFLKAKPKTDMDKCTHCGICIERCPMGSIDINDPSNIIGICIKCHACVKRCPVDAKYFDDDQFLSHKLMLERDFGQRIESQFFLGR